MNKGLLWVPDGAIKAGFIRISNLGFGGFGFRAQDLVGVSGLGFWV